MVLHNTIFQERSSNAVRGTGHPSIVSVHAENKRIISFDSHTHFKFARINFCKTNG